MLWKPLLFVPVALALSSVLPSQAASAAHAVEQSTPPATPASALTADFDGARVLLEAINRDRRSRHIPALFLDRAESRCSLRHSRHMATLASVSHDQFPADLCVRHTAGAENVGEAIGDTTSALLSLNEMMKGEGPCAGGVCSDQQFAIHGHYMNLMNPAFKRVGIGICVRDGITWLTEDFVR